MTALREAAQQALDYWEQVAWGDAVMASKMDALRAALAQQAEPVQESQTTQPAVAGPVEPTVRPHKLTPACQELLDNAIQDAAQAALAGIGVPPKRVDECGPQVLEFVKTQLQSYAELEAALGIRDAMVQPESPQRTPLSDETIDALWRAPMSADWEHREFARAIEQAHGIIESAIKEDKA